MYLGWLLALLLAIAGGIACAVQNWRLRKVEERCRNQEFVVAERTGLLEAANAELALARQKLQEHLNTDPLTGLFNRRYLAEHVRRDLAQLVRLPAARNLAILFILVDFDDLKRINDKHGHAIGDAILVEAAKRLRAVARETDYTVRWSGAEFLFVACFAEASSPTKVVERVMQCMWGAPYAPPGIDPTPVTGSAGFSIFPMGKWTQLESSPTSRDWEAAVTRADYALNRVKREKKGSWAGLVPGPDFREPSSGPDFLRDADALIERGVLQLILKG